MPVAALDNWQPVWNAQVSISTPVCVNFELRPGAGDIHICWFNFDALAQGNAYKPTKEPNKFNTYTTPTPPNPRFCIRVSILKPANAYLRPWTKSSLVQVMVYRLFGTQL